MYVCMFKGYMKTYFQDHISKAELSFMLNRLRQACHVADSCSSWRLLYGIPLSLPPKN